MVIVYGTRFYGKVQAAGRSFLATRFMHIWYLPLIPMGTQLILEDNGGSYKGMAAPFSMKSMLAAYLRVWGPVALILTITIGALSGASNVLGTRYSLVVSMALALTGRAKVVRRKAWQLRRPSW